MNKIFENAYEAVAALHNLADHVAVLGGSAIHNCANIINAEIDAVPYELVKHSRQIQRRLDALPAMLHAVTMQAFNVENNEAYVDAVQNLSRALFRCVSDIQDDLNGEERFDWCSDFDHWGIADQWYQNRHRSDNWEIKEAA
jgi:acid stress-induced BolA-like protein IbaG/YrbA